MKVDSLKPFVDRRYLSEEESLKLIESIPIPKDNASSNSASPTKAKPGTPEANNPLSDDNPIVDLEGRLIDLNPADNGNCKTQDNWIDYFNDRNEIMVSMPDLYFAGKSNNQALLSSLKIDFNENRIITSTRIIYEDKDNTRIIHYYGSNLIKSIEYKVVVPLCMEKPLTDVLGTKEGFDYLQALFGTKDNAKQIKETLQKLSNFPSYKIEVWSFISDRPSEWASYLEDSFGCKFWIDVDDPTSKLGNSRAMRVLTPGATQTTGGVK